MATPRRYWHGGAPGLGVGDYVLPRGVTGAQATAAYHCRSRPDRVYLATDRRTAVIWAALHDPTGVVYEVSPEGEMMPDANCRVPGLSCKCARAKVLSATRVTRSERRRVERRLGAPPPRGAP